MAGGFWLAQLYTMVDPDAASFRGDFWFAPNNWTRSISMDGRSRVAKAVVMGLLGHPDRAVQKEALLCCSKMMVVNWEFIERSTGASQVGGGSSATPWM